MRRERRVATAAIQAAVKGRETKVLEALGIAWAGGAPHISCPYPDHADENPSWRWDERKAKAYCTCIERSHSISTSSCRLRASSSIPPSCALLRSSVGMI